MRIVSLQWSALAPHYSAGSTKHFPVNESPSRLSASKEGRECERVRPRHNCQTGCWRGNRPFGNVLALSTHHPRSGGLAVDRSRKSEGPQKGARRGRYTTG